MVSAMAPAPPSGRSSRATQVTTAWPSRIRSTACGHPVGLVGRQREGVARVDLAEAARPRAAFAVDHEGRRAVGPALVDVRAPRLLAHGDEPEIVDGRPEPAVALADAARAPVPIPACAARCRGPPRVPPRPGAGGAGAGAPPSCDAPLRTRPGRAPRRGAPHSPSPKTAMARATKASTHGLHRRRRCPRLRSDVTPRSAMPHGTMWPNMARSVVTLSATPWSVRRRPGPARRVRTPMAAILRACRPPASSHTPGILVLARRPGQAEVGQRVRSPPARGDARAPDPRPGSSGTVTIG